MVNNSLPSLTTARLSLFPNSIRIRSDALDIGGQSLTQLADQFGTPLYIYDLATLDANVEAYRAALSRHYPGSAEITYAGKAFLCNAIAQWAHLHELWVDCTGAGEIGIAVAAGVPRENILVHGVNKSAADLASALKHAATIVVDNLTELGRIGDLVARSNRGAPDLWLRLQPGLAVQTHHSHTQTGQSDSKFGMTAEELKQAAAICKEQHLPLRGLHFHQGSNFRDPSPLIPAIALATELVRHLGLGEPWHLSPGGGWGVAYHEDELPQPEIEEYIRVVSEAVLNECQRSDLTLPILHLEPGRSLIARAGVALYRVGTVKQRNGKYWLLTDGGMTDNPRYALYGSKYSCLPAVNVSREMSAPVNIAGPNCESGDILVEDLLMPKLEVGELIAIPVSGAYHLSMSSNYNGALRPAVVFLENGNARLVTKREELQALSNRDLFLG